MEDDITSNELNHSEFLFFFFFRMPMQVGYLSEVTEVTACFCHNEVDRPGGDTRD